MPKKTDNCTTPFPQQSLVSPIHNPRSTHLDLYRLQTPGKQLENKCVKFHTNKAIKILVQ